MHCTIIVSLHLYITFQAITVELHLYGPIGRQTSICSRKYPVVLVIIVYTMRFTLFLDH